MSNTKPTHLHMDNGKPVTAAAGPEPGLDELIAQMRLELTGSAAAMLQTASPDDGVLGTHAAGVEQFAGPDAAPLSVGEVMSRVRLELERRRAGSPTASIVSTKAVPANGDLPRWRPSAARLPTQPMYVLADLLRFFDGDFVDNAFKTLLRRPANAQEKLHYLSALRSGGVGKVEVLGDIRFSDEGMQHCVHVDGLLLPYKLHKWRRVPVFGWFLATAIAIFRLPRLFAHLQKLEAGSAQESQEVGLALNALAQAVDVQLAHMQVGIDSCAGREDMRALTVVSNRLRDLLETQASRLAQIAQADDETRAAVDLIEGRLSEQAGAHAKREARLSDEVQSLTAASSRLQDQLETQASKLAKFALIDQEARGTVGALEARLDKAAQLEAELKARLESGLADRAAAHAQLEQRVQTQSPLVAKVAGDSAENRRAVRDIERRLMAFFDHTSRQTTDARRSGPDLPQEGTGVLDAHYVSFEDTFRGTREDIKARSGHYLETFSEAGMRKDEGLVLDLGCGRGEWLEVLTENGYTCRGVDLNSVMISEALALGLDAVKCDAVAYLRSLDNESVSAVTSMHLVEHIPYEVLITLLDEASRVLQPGGVLILETPNPENLTVGSCWFYMDPTHRNPIPPTLLQWVVQARGFEHAAVDRLTQNREVFDIQPVDEEVAGSSQINKIIGLLTAAPDYAIVARKPVPSSAQLQES
ncbi:MAG: methyltransferase domain-containing protein [Devosia sp.]